MWRLPYTLTKLVIKTWLKFGWSIIDNKTISENSWITINWTFCWYKKTSQWNKLILKNQIFSFYDAPFVRLQKGRYQTASAWSDLMKFIGIGCSCSKINPTRKNTICSNFYPESLRGFVHRHGLNSWKLVLGRYHLSRCRKPLSRVTVQKNLWELLAPPKVQNLPGFVRQSCSAMTSTQIEAKIGKGSVLEVLIDDHWLSCEIRSVFHVIFPFRMVKFLQKEIALETRGQKIKITALQSTNSTTETLLNEFSKLLQN